MKGDDKYEFSMFVYNKAIDKTQKMYTCFD